MSSHYKIDPGGKMTGAIHVPGDKSISHRAIMLGALADGVTEIDGFLNGEDCIATINAFRSLGVTIKGPDDRSHVTVHGVGLYGLKHSPTILDLGNSGTSMRLLSGILAAQPFASVLTGDESLLQRPMQRVTQPLIGMGAKIETTKEGTAPLRIGAVSGLNAIHFEMPIASAQVKSCLLLAGLYANGTTCVTEPAITRDHTGRMLETFACPVRREGNTACIEGRHRLKACSLQIPADISSAAFFMVGASIAPGSDLVIEGVGMNPTRTGVIDILRLMGADIMLTNQRDYGAEPVADIRVRHAPLHGIDIPPALVPLAIDEFPAVFVAAACAEGETVLAGAHELRVKESDRIQVMADGLTRLGINAEPTDDGLRIQSGRFRGGEVNSHGDHRIAMAFSVAALRATAAITVTDCANVATSFPGFAKTARKAGLLIQG
ncbi:MAG: 3-phosphoshikimate 1-carboxyvinyltransferase [Gammaproteobacteria bacterium]|nr:MAG: 3-phosphoshikimate 1-carboxyvinyltransferase [Gammaproteobacteria bacterium]